MVYTNPKDLRRSAFPRSRFKGSSLPQYVGGGWLETANYFMNSDQGQKLVGNLGQLGTMVGAADAVDGKMNPYLSTGAGALKGAQMGAKLGSVVPGLGTAVGAGVGALVGGGAALLKARKEEEAREEAELQKQKEEEYRKESLRVANLQTDKGILDAYPTTGVTDAGFMMAYGGDKNPPAFDMSLLAGNNLPGAASIAHQQTIGGNANATVPMGYSDIVRSAAGGAGEVFSDQNIAQAKQEAKDFKTNVVDYAVEHPADAAQIALGTTAIAAGKIPNPVAQAVGAGADVLNGAISFGRSGYYGYKGKPAKAAMCAGFGAVDMAAGVPGVAGDMASIAKMKNLYNASKGGHAAEAIAHTGHAVHNVQHAAHEVAPLITGYKAAGATNDIVAGGPKANSIVPQTAVNTQNFMNYLTPGVDTSWAQPKQYDYNPNRLAMGGKIPTGSAHYLAEGGEVIQHAVNDRPDTDQNGDAKQLNSNTSLLKGDSHDAPSQGIGVANDQEARIYSNRLYAPKDLVAKLKSL